MGPIECLTDVVTPDTDIQVGTEGDGDRVAPPVLGTAVPRQGWLLLSCARRIVWHCVALWGTAWHCVALCDIVWHGVVLCSRLHPVSPALSPVTPCVPSGHPEHLRGGLGCGDPLRGRPGAGERPRWQQDGYQGGPLGSGGGCP